MLHKQVCQYFIAPALLLSVAFGISPVTASPEATDLVNSGSPARVPRPSIS